MSGNAAVDRRTARREATRREILAAAHALAHERGVAAWAMRDLGARVGMRAQSLYGYFPSKHALLDALFAQGYADLLARVRALPLDGDPRTRLRRHAHAFVDFAVEDLPRYQLLFQRTVPGFEPSTASYELSVAALGTTRAALAACGIGTTHDVDLYTAVLGGVVAQQNANEPGGHRWTRLVDEALDMYLAHVRPDDQEPP